MPKPPAPSTRTISYSSRRWPAGSAWGWLSGTRAILRQHAAGDAATAATAAGDIALVDGFVQPIGTQSWSPARHSRPPTRTRTRRRWACHARRGPPEARRLARPVARTELVTEHGAGTSCLGIGTRPVSEINTADALQILTPIWHVKAATAREIHQQGQGQGGDRPCQRPPVFGPGCVPPSHLPGRVAPLQVVPPGRGQRLPTTATRPQRGCRNLGRMGRRAAQKRAERLFPPGRTTDRRRTAAACVGAGIL